MRRLQPPSTSRVFQVFGPSFPSSIASPLSKNSWGAERAPQAWPRSLSQQPRWQIHHCLYQYTRFTYLSMIIRSNSFEVRLCIIYKNTLLVWTFVHRFSKVVQMQEIKRKKGIKAETKKKDGSIELISLLYKQLKKQECYHSSFRDFYYKLFNKFANIKIEVRSKKI